MIGIWLRIVIYVPWFFLLGCIEHVQRTLIDPYWRR